MGIGFIVIVLVLGMLLGLFSRQALTMADEAAEIDSLQTSTSDGLKAPSSAESAQTDSNQSQAI